MHARATSAPRRNDLQTPVRNRYFYGKLLDVYHFEMETNYLNAKRWLLNRLLVGYGVVCGLDVQWAAGHEQIVVTPGLAIDKWGREVIVPEKTTPISVQATLARQGTDCSESKESEGNYVHVVLCYHECLGDPAPVLTGECSDLEPCSPGSIRERYKVEFRPGCAPPIAPTCRFKDRGILTGSGVNYSKLAQAVTDAGCAPLAKDPCIPLANIRISSEGEEHACDPEDIHIGVRPIVYSNLLLFDLLLCEMEQDHES